MCNLIDSVMPIFKIHDLKMATKIGNEIVEKIKSIFPPEIVLELEQISDPFLLLKKKKYIKIVEICDKKTGKKYLKICPKGIELVRRDSCSFCKETIRMCVHYIMIEKKPQKAQEYLKLAILKLMAGEIDLNYLTYTKCISREFESYKTPQIQIELAKKIEKRSGERPKKGSRITYAIILDKNKSALSNRAESPQIIFQKKIPLDLEYYLGRLKDSILRIFSVFNGIKECFNIKYLKKPKTTYKKYGILKFTLKLSTCIICNDTLLNKDKHKRIYNGICHKCHGDNDKIAIQYEKKLNESKYYGKMTHRAWTTCQRCKGVLHRDVKCRIYECPIYYMRSTAKEKYNQSLDEMEKFDYINTIF